MLDKTRGSLSRKIAVLSMDVEDWYHTEYIKGPACNRSYTMLDGLDHFIEICASESVPVSLFVLGELVRPLGSRLRELDGLGHDIGSHGWLHQRPLTMSAEEFQEELRRCRDETQDVLGKPVAGFRASCFSLDRQRLETIRKTGFLYDSSRIQVRQHPLYGSLDMDGFEKVSPGIFRNDEFLEFEISTLPMGRLNLPVAGGAYLRIFPWTIMQRLIRRYLEFNELYVLYIHPFEVSRRNNPVFPDGTPTLQKIRFKTGRTTTGDKLSNLIRLLRVEGFEFMNFANLRQRLLGESGVSHIERVPLDGRRRVESVSCGKQSNAV